MTGLERNYQQLLLAVLVQTCWDIAMLQRAGVLKAGGEVIDPEDWPKGGDTYGYKKTQWVNNYYHKSSQVQELCEFVTGPLFSVVLDFSSCSVSQTRFVQMLTGEVGPAIDLATTNRKRDL